MQTWPVQDAKARFSEFLDACLQEGPQMVTRRGAEAAVLVPMHEWRRLQSAARPSLKQLLKPGDVIEVGVKRLTKELIKLVENEKWTETWL